MRDWNRMRGKRGMRKERNEGVELQNERGKRKMKKE